MVVLTTQEILGYFFVLTELERFVILSFYVVFICTFTLSVSAIRIY